MTETLVYDLQPLRVAGTDETWNVASCNNARLRDEVHLGRRETVAADDDGENGAAAGRS